MNQSFVAPPSARIYSDMSAAELLTAAMAYDSTTRQHIGRVRGYAVTLARAVGVSDESLIEAIDEAALFHDIGKLMIPARILNKPGRLTDSEFDEMRQHVDMGAAMLALLSLRSTVVPIVRAHHENWDGSGYLRGLKGAAIPLGARILSVADCFDALTSDRPYRSRLPAEEALLIVRERRGTMYDPAVVDIFMLAAMSGSIHCITPCGDKGVTER
jgi:putative nucleotidyltransferase with HDIG domain